MGSIEVRGKKYPEHVPMTAFGRYAQREGDRRFGCKALVGLAALY